MLPNQVAPDHITPIVCAEIGNVHDGSLGNAHRLIDAAADAGVHAVKMQCHIASVESSDSEQFPERFQFHPQDRSRMAYWSRMEFTRSQWYELSDRARQRGLLFGVAPFSTAAVHRVEGLVDFYKIASGELTNLAMLQLISSMTWPRLVVVSSGMSTIAELETAMMTFLRNDQRTRHEVIMCQCTTRYPTPASQVGMNMVDQFRRNITCLGGLSDHSGTIWPSIVASWLGAAYIEVHICWDRRQFGADVSSSITIDELRQLVQGVKFADTMRKMPVDKDEILKQLPDTAVYRTGKQRRPYEPYAALLKDRD